MNRRGFFKLVGGSLIAVPLAKLTPTEPTMSTFEPLYNVEYAEGTFDQISETTMKYLRDTRLVDNIFSEDPLVKYFKEQANV